MGGVYVYHSMGWLLTLYTLNKQKDPSSKWETWLQEFFSELLGKEAVTVLIDIMLTLKDVETLEGLSPGEEPRGYYSLWALNISQLAPESLPRWGPLNDVVVNYRGQLCPLGEKRRQGYGKGTYF